MSELIFSTWKGQQIDGRVDADKTAEDVSVPKQLPNGIGLKGVMGWDGLAIWDDVNPIDLARAYAKGLGENSCGQCVPCRVGSNVMENMLADICAGNGEYSYPDTIAELAVQLREQSMCDLGQSCGKAFTDFIENFRPEVEKAIAGKTVIAEGEYLTQVTAPCKAACPAHLEIPVYVEDIKKGRFTESLHLIRRDNCLPGTVGRVCFRPCEDACRRSNADEQIQIKYLKRFVADYELEHKKECLVESTKIDKEKIAIIGAGPAGLSCANYLAQLGYDCTVYEALGEPGGMAAVGIPDYRLPRKLLQHEVSLIENLGVTIKYNTDIGSDVMFNELTNGDYAAVFIGIGARLGTSMGVEGEGDEIEGFFKGADYLRDIALGRMNFRGKTAVIVGGGNVAIDCVRSSLREGFEDVKIVYRRSEAEMPAEAVEIADAKAEGIEFCVLTNPTKVISEKNKVTGLEVVKMELGEPDDSGRRRPQAVEGSEYVIPTDAVVMAIGQGIDLTLIPEDSGLETTRWDTIVTEKLNRFARKVNGVPVFSGGDCETGPDSLIAALGAGKEAAYQIDQYLREDGTTAPMDEWVMNKYIDELGPYDNGEDVGVPSTTESAKIKHLPADSRIKDYSEVEIGFTHEEAIEEASRCLRCYRLMVAAK